MSIEYFPLEDLLFEHCTDNDAAHALQCGRSAQKCPAEGCAKDRDHVVGAYDEKEQHEENRYKYQYLALCPALSGSGQDLFPKALAFSAKGGEHGEGLDHVASGPVRRSHGEKGQGEGTAGEFPGLQFEGSVQCHS